MSNNTRKMFNRFIEVDDSTSRISKPQIELKSEYELTGLTTHEIAINAHRSIDKSSRAYMKHIADLLWKSKRYN